MQTKCSNQTKCNVPSLSLIAHLRAALCQLPLKQLSPSNLDTSGCGGRSGGCGLDALLPEVVINDAGAHLGGQSSQECGVHAKGDLRREEYQQKIWQEFDRER